ncbi:hypothetical protein EU528_11935 [Candidatus Thorarchaeota archaeon]|nr:MAG: hypothetical protein EU528_11935 [Candidatus Thorarchaeota archaeon]
MRKKEICAFAFLFALLSMQIVSGAMAYAIDIHPVQDAGTVVKWEVTHAPEAAFSMYFTGAGSCLIENGSTMSFSVGEINDDVRGLLSIGNVSFLTNDTDVARDLVLGVGIFSPFEPGLFVKVGASNIETLNDSAFAASERISGNFMNGTMKSHWDYVTIGGSEYVAIIFNYEQDPPFAGDPQRTQLAYDLSTGVLLYANTSYWFGEGFEPYWLEIEFIEITHEGAYLPPTYLYPIIIASVIIILLIVMVARKRM